MIELGEHWIFIHFFKLTLHQRFANATHVLLCESRWLKLALVENMATKNRNCFPLRFFSTMFSTSESMENKPNNTHTHLKGFNWWRLARHVWGPLRTQAKSHDHEIVRAQKKCPRPSQNTSKNHVVWSHAPKCSVKVICDWAIKQMLFQWISIHAESSHTTKYNKPTIVRFRSAIVSWF
jgi:hypothetical protein